MPKQMHRLISLLLCIVMLLSMTLTVAADFEVITDTGEDVSQVSIDAFLKEEDDGAENTALLQPETILEPSRVQDDRGEEVEIFVQEYVDTFIDSFLAPEGDTYPWSETLDDIIASYEKLAEENPDFEFDYVELWASNNVIYLEVNEGNFLQIASAEEYWSFLTDTEKAAVNAVLQERCDAYNALVEEGAIIAPEFEDMLEEALAVLAEKEAELAQSENTEPAVDIPEGETATNAGEKGLDGNTAADEDAGDEDQIEASAGYEQDLLEETVEDSGDDDGSNESDNGQTNIPEEAGAQAAVEAEAESEDESAKNEVGIDTSLPLDAQILTLNLEALPRSMYFGMSAMMEASTTTDAYVQLVRLKSQQDGGIVAPLDSNNNPGNDSSSTNNIVRSFDRVNYEIEYYLESTTAVGVFSEADIDVELTLNCPRSVATFDLSAMNWLNNASLDDSSGTTQVLTGTRHVMVEGGGTTSNYVATLNVPITNIYGANGDTFELTYKLSTAANESGSYSALNDGTAPEVTISARPMLNVEILRTGTLDELGWYNFTDGTGSKTAPAGWNSEHPEYTPDIIYGRMELYSIGVMLQNDDPNKGMCGIELPTGQIEFDLQMVQWGNDTYYGLIPYLWAGFPYERSLEDNYNNGYSISSAPPTYNGSAFVPSLSSGGASTRNIVWATGVGRSVGGMSPYNSYTTNGINAHSTSRVCWNGGLWQFEYTGLPHSGYGWEDENESVPVATKYHVTITEPTGGWFNWDDWISPEAYVNSGDFGIEYNTYYQTVFATGSVQVLLNVGTDARNSPGIAANIDIQVETHNLTATSVSGQSYNNEIDLDDNHTYMSIPVYKEGSYSTGQWFRDTATATYLSSDHSWVLGDNKAYRGQKIYVQTDITHLADYSGSAFTYLLKFDPDALRLDYDTVSLLEQTAWPIYTNPSVDGYLGDITAWYAAKPNGHSWEGATEEDADDEMERTRTKDLIYYKTLEELEADGKICVGLLVEGRNGRYIQGHGSLDMQIWLEFFVLDDAQIGHVNQICDDSYFWLENQAQPGNLMTVIGNGAYTMSEPTGFWAVETADRDSGTYVGYGKATYDSDGNFTGGHTNGFFWGNSLLVVGYEPHVTSTVEKEIYDLDAGERTATFTATPSTISAIGGQTDNLYVQVTLPNQLRYLSGTALYGDRTITPSISYSGSDQILTFILANEKIGTALPSITYQCRIGNPVSSSQDVINGQTLTSTTAIWGDFSKGPRTTVLGNLATSTISVVKLLASHIVKITDTPLVPVNTNFNYTLAYSNESTYAAENVKIFDILPYNNDSRGTNYDGSYVVSNVRVDYANARSMLDKTNSVYYTTDESIRSMTSTRRMTNNITWTNATIYRTDETHFCIDYTIPNNATAIRFDFAQAGINESIGIDITCSPTGNHGGNLYVNNFYQNADGQMTQLRSNDVEVRVKEYEITVQKYWIDQHNTTPNVGRENLDVVLQKSTNNGASWSDDRTVTLRKDEGWQTTVTVDYDAGATLYRVFEPSMPGVSTTYSSNNTGVSDAATLTITNTLLCSTLTVTKSIDRYRAGKSNKFQFIINGTDAFGNTYTNETLELSPARDTSINDNILRGTAQMTITDYPGAWSAGAFRQSGSGSISTVTVSDSPVEGVTKGILIDSAGSGGDSCGFAQDLFRVSSKVGQTMTLSGWFKGTAGDSVMLQPYYMDLQGETEWSNGSFTLATNDWEYHSFTSTPLQYDHTSEIGLSIGYVYLNANTAGNTLLVCGLKEEWGSAATDWTKSMWDNLPYPGLITTGNISNGTNSSVATLTVPYGTYTITENTSYNSDYELQSVTANRNATVSGTTATANVSSSQGSAVTFNNKLKQYELTIEKIWQDEIGNQTTDVPAYPSLTLHLQRKSGSTWVNDRDVVLTAAGGWTTTLTLDYDNNLYRIQEDALPGITTTYSTNNAAGVNDEATLTVTNQLQMHSLYITKNIDKYDSTVPNTFQFTVSGTDVFGVAYTINDSRSRISVGGGKTATSNHNALMSIPAGTYTITENETYNTEYTLDNVIAGANTTVSGTTATATLLSGNAYVTFENKIVPLPTATIVVDKEINEQYAPFGTPTFIFTVTGTDVRGDTHTYTQMIEIDATNKGSATFEVPIGTYTVSELGVARYKLTGVTRVAGSVSISGSGANAVPTCTVNTDGAYAEVKYTNTITQYEKFSHNDAVTNHFSP